MSEFRKFTVDYRKDSGRDRRGVLVNRGFFLHGIPRPLLTCRTVGHKPVVDGTEAFRPGGPAARWVCCDRCGVRPDSQGRLDAAQWDIGDRYTGPWGDPPAPYRVPKSIDDYRPENLPEFFPPGPWKKSQVWEFGGQAIVGKTFRGFAAEVKVGNCGSEQTLAAHISLNPVGALYLHTERLGTWLQRRVNPTGYESRVIGVSVERGSIDWKLWAKRNDYSSGDPWWQHGTIKLDPRDKILGRRRYWHTDEGKPVIAIVRLPHGDDHEVKLQLQRCEKGREKRPRKDDGWSADWNGPAGIPTKPNGRGGIWGFGVEVSAESVRRGTWPFEAAAKIAARLTETRAKEGMGAADDDESAPEFDAAVRE